MWEGLEGVISKGKGEEGKGREGNDLGLDASSVEDDSCFQR